MTEERTEQRRGLRGILRLIVIWIAVIVIAAAGGFGTGYFLRDQDVREAEQRLAKEKAETTSLKMQVLEAQKSHLEQALARAKLRGSLDEVLDLLTGSLAEVEQRNFGRAMQKVEAARAVVSTSGNTPTSFRDTVNAKLDEIKTGLEQLDVKTAEQISRLTQDLEKGVLPGKTSEGP